MNFERPSSLLLQLHVTREIYLDNGMWNATTLGRYTFHRTWADTRSIERRPISYLLIDMP